MSAAPKPFKVRQKVTFATNSKSGAAVIKSINPGGRGLWYALKTSDGYLLSVRAGQMQPA
jgi:hypothetical protein